MTAITRKKEVPCRFCGNLFTSGYHRDKHERVCGLGRGEARAEEERFTNKFSKRKYLCPICRNEFKSQYHYNDELMVCMDCGLVFMNPVKLESLRAVLRGIKWSRE